MLVILLKKKYLLSREDLTLDWIPLYELYHYWEDSSFAVRGLVRGHDELKSQIKSLIQYSRSYFSNEATQQMLDRWRPMFCPLDRAFFTAFRYLSLFLPTTQKIPPDHGYKLWFDEFLLASISTMAALLIPSRTVGVSRRRHRRQAIPSPPLGQQPLRFDNAI